MEDLLLLEYPSMANRIKKARELGFSDDEIGKELQGRVERARAKGFSELEISQGLGVTEESRSLLQEARKTNALETISEAYDLTIPRARKALEKKIHPAVLTDEEIARRMEEEDKQVQVGAMHDRPSVETLRTHSRFWRDLNDPAIGATNRAVGGMVAGFATAAGGFSRGLEWLTGWEAARSFADRLEWAGQSLGTEILEGSDPNLWDAFWQGSGSMAFFLLPGMAVGKAVTGTAALTNALGLSRPAAIGLARFLGATTSGVMEGLAEAGPVYKMVLEATGDEGAASLAASKTFWLNLPLNIITDKLGFFGDNKLIRNVLAKALPDRTVNLLANVLSRGIAEGIQETAQSAISTRYGEGKAWSDLDLGQSLVQEGIPGFLVAAITGSTFESGAALHAVPVKEAAKSRFKASAARVYTSVKEQLMATGMDEKSAHMNAVMWSQRAYVVGAQTGTDPEVWFKRQGLSVKRGAAPQGEVAFGYDQDGVPLGEKAFNEWFSGSKVVDATGKPLVVSHSTPEVFDAFDVERGELGAHFGTEEQAGSLRGDSTQGRTVKAYLNIKNPVRMIDWGHFDAYNVSQELLRLGLVTEDEAVRLQDLAMEDERQANAEIRSIIQGAGYDGVVYLNRREGINWSPEEAEWLEMDGTNDALEEDDEGFLRLHPEARDSWIALSPEQIKSVENKGTWSRQTANIYYQSEANNTESTGNPVGLVLNQDGRLDQPQDPNVAQPLWKKPWEVYKNLPKPQKKLVDRLARGRWVIMSAVNPKHSPMRKKGKKVSWLINPQEDEPAKMAKLAGALEALGAKITSTLGNYDGEEVSMLAEGVTIEDALDLARETGQESIMTNFGLVYTNGRVVPIKPGDSLTIDNDLDNYYTVINIDGEDIKFSFDLDWANDYYILEHWSQTPDLEVLDPAYGGTGKPGEEDSLRKAYPELFVPRTYHYGMNVAQRREAGLGNQRYVTFVEGKDVVDLTDPKVFNEYLQKALEVYNTGFDRFVDGFEEAEGMTLPPLFGERAWELVRESEFERRQRKALGHTKIVLVDPTEIREAWEAEHPDEKLVHSPARLERLGEAKTFDAYPKVTGHGDGSEGIDISDGRHRIAEAERRGTLIPVAMPEGKFAIPQRFIKGELERASKTPTGDMLLNEIMLGIMKREGKKGAAVRSGYAAITFEPMETRAWSPNVPLTIEPDIMKYQLFRGKPLYECSMEELEAWGAENGIPNFGPLSPMQKVGDVDIPGGLDGTFTYMDLMYLKRAAIDPNTIPEPERVRLYTKLADTHTNPATMTEEERQVKVFNDMAFAILSAQNSLFDNELAAYLVRARDRSDIEALAALGGEKGAAMSAVKSKKLSLAVKDNQFDYVARMARLWLKDPSWFLMKPGESEEVYSTRMASVVPGLGTKTSMFGAVWQNPRYSMAMAIDRHMVRLMWDRVFSPKEQEDILHEFSLQYQKDNKLNSRVDFATIEEATEAIGRDEVVEQIVSKHIKAERKTLTSKQAPAFVKDIVWVEVPEHVYFPSAKYLKALEIGKNEVRKMGLEGTMGIFVYQWMAWDMARGVVEPHEAVFPGMNKAPKMPSAQLAVIYQNLKALGWKPIGKTWNKPSPHQGPEGRVFYQDEVQSPRGRLEVTDSGERLVSLFENADESTFMHESGHIFLLDFEELASMPDTPPEIKKDWETLKNWLGVEDGQTLDTTHHEKFARGFEAWLMEGEAPHPRLASVFEHFRRWLTNIYKSVSELDVVLSDDVRGVFDRMFALEDEIESRVFYQDSTKPVDALPPDPEERAETEAVMAMEGPANRAAEGDEEALFDPVWFDEGSPEGATEVDDFMAAAEAIAMKTEAYKGWQNLVRSVRNLGGISYDQVANLMGTDFATRLRETVGWLYRRTGLALDEMAMRLAQQGFDVTDAQNLFNQLTNRPENPNQLPPVLEVTQDNLPWLLEKLGTAQTRRYLKRRIQAIDASIEELRAEHEKLSNEGKDEALAALVKEELWKLYSERTLAAETEEQLKKAPRETPKGETLRWQDMARKAKGDAFRWVQAKVLDTVLAVTGQTAVGELVSESEALKEAMRLAQRWSKIAARIARKTGYRAGYIAARQRVAEVKRRQQARAQEKAEIKALVKDLDTATRGSISWNAKEKIADILEKYDTRRRGVTQAVREMAERAGMKPKEFQKNIDAEMRQFLADNPQAEEDFSPEDLARLTRQSVYEMTLDELRALHQEVMGIREAGQKELQEKQRIYQEKRQKTVEALVNGLGGRAKKSGQKMVPGQKKRSKMEYIKAWSWTPSRILNWLDDYGNFKGLWHNVFMRRADSAEDAFLRGKFSRHDGMMARMKALGITESDLAAIRYATVDPETGEKVDFTLDQIMEVYAGWLNEKKRDALKYGNGIDEAMKAEMEKLLKPNEIELVKAVLEDYEARRKALKEALVDTYDVGFLDEPFYTPMYRDSWEASGELIDTGMEALKNEFMRVNGLRRFYAKHGFSHTRKTISPEHQAPLQIGLFGNWLKSVDIQEHFIAYATMVKEFQDVIKDPDLRQTLEARYGEEVYKTLEHFVNRLAVPDFYKGYAATDVLAKFVRSNAAVAYLAYNLGTVLKQPTALAYYLRDAGPLNLLMSAFEFAISPRRTLHNVWELDPQVKDQAIERTLEELKRTKDPRYKRIRHAIGRAGFKPILWFDMVTRVVGWNAVYRAELARGASPEDARYRAQRVTLNTQQAANPKELPRFMAQNEFLNLMTVFQNQANKVWNIASHDLWGDIKKGRIGGALGTSMGLLTATFLLSLLTKGRPPEDPKELANYLSEDIIGSIPLLGKGLVSSWNGFSGGTALDTAVKDLGQGLKGLSEFEVGGKEILALYEAYSLLLGGVPVTAIKRIIRVADEGRPGAILGWRKEKKKRSAMAYF